MSTQDSESPSASPTSPYQLVFTNLKVGNEGHGITYYILNLYFQHPEWFSDVRVFSFETFSVRDKTLKAEYLKMHKDNMLFTQTDKEDVYDGLGTTIRPLQTAMRSFVFQFDDDKECLAQVNHEEPYAPVCPYATTNPFLYKRTILTFKTRAVMDTFCNIYAKYRLTDQSYKFPQSIRVYSNIQKAWSQTFCKTIPDLENIFVKRDIKQSITQKIDSFMRLEARSKKFGKPCKLNILLHGVPGSGKTSIVKAIANHYNRHLYMMSFAKDMTDSEMNTLLEDVRDNSILVLEDIDSFFIQRESKCNVSFSCLLNTLDGVMNCDKNLITILTANHPEALDPALLRPGRIDMLVKFDYPEKDEVFDAFAAYSELPTETVTKEFNKFYKHIKGLKLPMSLITDYLFHHQHDYIESIHELLNHHDSLKEILKDKGERMYL